MGDDLTRCLDDRDRDCVASMTQSIRRAFVSRAIGGRPIPSGRGALQRALTKLAARYRSARCGVLAVHGNTIDPEALASSVRSMFLTQSVTEWGENRGEQARYLEIINNVGMVLAAADTATRRAIAASRKWRRVYCEIPPDGAGAVHAIVDRFRSNHESI